MRAKSELHDRIDNAHESFQKQELRSPEAVAAVFGHRHITYAELDRWSNRFAHFLRAKDIGREDLVGICLHRSLEMLVAILGILKAGAAYLPLDPANPQSRLKTMVGDAGPALLVAEEDTAELLPADPNSARIDRDWGKISGLPSHPPEVEVSGRNLAYVIYTSGSTGVPKGVMIEHRSLANLTAGLIADDLLEERDRFLQFASIGFDASAAEIYPCLASGATLVLRSPEMIQSAQFFLQESAKRQLTLMELPTAFWHQLSAEMEKSRIPLPPSLRVINIGGEVGLPQFLRAWRKRPPGLRLFNTYGPTESTVNAATCEISDDEGNLPSIPIGFPFHGLRIHILDEAMRPVEDGGQGELYIEGIGLARGYLKRPSLTAASFLPNPFGDPGESSGSRLYRTGDVGRLLPDGRIEFLGRTDHQVKLRGFRIELGEIEAVLASHPEIAQAVVMLREDAPGSKRLVAYLQAGKESLTVDQLRDFLKERLPEYMVPAVFVTLDDFPLTASGKIDRSHLPLPAPSRPDLEQPFVPAETPDEQAMVKIFREVLALERVGLKDDFFHLGGHSLLAAQIIARIREVFQVEIDYGAFFRSPHVAGLTESVKERRQSSSASRFPPLRPADPSLPPPLSFSQERVWFISQMSPTSRAYNAYLTVRFKGLLDVDALRESLNEVIRRHEILRTSFPLQDEQPVQRIHPPWQVDLPLIDLRALPEVEREAEVRRLVGNACRSPFDVTRIPLLSWSLLKLADREHLWIQVEHHLLHDGWSMSRLASEIESLYRAFSQGLPSPLSAPRRQFRDFAFWQREWVESQAAKEQMAFWKAQLAHCPDLLKLPTSRSRPRAQSFEGRVIRMELDPELAADLRSLSHRQGVTFFMTLVALFKVLLRFYTGRDDIQIGTGLANRRLRESEEILGMIINNVVLRADLSGNPTLGELLGRIKETTLDAYANQDLPFDKVVEGLRPKPNLSYNPLFQVMFSFHDAPMPDLNLPRLKGRFEYPHNDTAKFDLNVIVTPRAEQRVGRKPQDEDQSVLLEWEYNTALFEEGTVAGWIAHYRQLLESACRDPRQRLSQLPSCRAEERVQVVHLWNQTERPSLRQLCVHQLFEAQADRRAEAEAVLFGGQGLTYRALDRRANQVARRLHDLGVGPEVRVGIYLDRSPQMVAALLGVLKAGGAYVPLDPEYPAERFAFIAANAQIKVLVTQERLARGLPLADFSVLDLDSPDLEKEITDRLEEVKVRPGHLSHVIYTSGSTGHPKGVAITHAATAAMLDWARQSFSRQRLSGVLASTSVCFDLSVFEIFAPLCCGGRLILARNALDLATLPERLKVTLVNTVPSAMSELLRLKAVPRSVATVNLAGEPLRASLVREIYRLGHVDDVYNLYGPSEDTTYSTYARVSQQEEKPSIGKPVSNTRAYLLNRHLQPVPVGVEGRLYLAGHGLARGYFGAPAMTAERFIPDPFGADPGGRLYDTGDLARWSRDGRLDFVGRQDHQIKLRGFRIELGEIETVLRRHPQVREGVVAAREDEAGSKRLVAYVVPEKAGNLSVDDVQDYLGRTLPGYMLPSVFVTLESLPLTPNGKIDRKSLPAPSASRPALKEDFAAPLSSSERLVAAVWKEVLGLDEVGVRDNFFDLGGHSLLLTQVFVKLSKQLGVPFQLVDLFEYPTIRSFCKRLARGAGDADAASQPSKAGRAPPADRSTDGEGIAIVGMACRLPGARNLEEFWANLRDGVESIAFFPDDVLRAGGVPDELLNDPDYVKAGTILSDADRFDASFFGYNPREAAMMDPQQRVFLECCWNALENAGYGPGYRETSVGVFGGCAASTYPAYLSAGRASSDAVDRYQWSIGNDKDFLTTRVSYKLGLKGPSLTVQTACSSSLVAIHLACQNLMEGNCRLALAGGVSISFPQHTGYLYRDRMIRSPDGHCRAFDADARGTVFGNGCGVVVLKPLRQAIADGDTIRAVVRAAAINNDGAVKVGYTAPSVEGQVRVIKAALQRAGIGAETVTYVEAHGTGTEIGDPIELQALDQVFSSYTPRKNFCAIGSVKTNIGHLDAAAGVAGVIKTVLALQHRTLPPSLHYKRPNPRIDFTRSAFFVNAEGREWASDGSPLRAGVSSFGVGGTNAHLILEQAPEAKPSDPADSHQVLVLSAGDESALQRSSRNLGAFLKANPQLNLADVAHTLQVGRRPLKHRRALVCRDISEAADLLESADSAQLLEAEQSEDERACAFLFPGQGSQYVEMGRGLYQEYHRFKDCLDSCCQHLEKHLDLDLRRLLFPDPEGLETAEETLTRTEYSQPALLVLEYALAEQWKAWGIRPSAMIGHSIGEYTAALLADVFSLEDALKLVAVRGRLIQRLPAGDMLAVAQSAQELKDRLGSELSLAACNAPGSCVVSGPAAAVNRLREELSESGVACRLLHTSHAFHSPMMDPMLEDFHKEVAKIDLRPPKIPFVSNLTGDWVKPEECTSPRYWVDHLRHTVRFSQGLQTLMSRGKPALLEVGPGNTLSALAGRSFGEAAVPSMGHPKDPRADAFHLAKALAQLWLRGVDVDWGRVKGPRRRQRIPLPTYPFSRQRHWMEEIPPSDASPTRLPSKVTDVSKWFYLPSWRRAAPAGLSACSRRRRELWKPGTHWLLLGDEDGLGEEVNRQLFERELKTVLVRPGDSYERSTANRFRIDPGSSDDYSRLFKELGEEGIQPQVALHLWSLTKGHDDSSPMDGLQSSLLLGFESLLGLVQGFRQCHPAAPLHIEVVCNGIKTVSGEEEIFPAKAAILGPCQVIPREHLSIDCRIVDIVWPPPDDEGRSRISGQLLEEWASDPPAVPVALRGRHRWLECYQPVHLQARPQGGVTLHERGLYLITGGLGGIGLIVARHLARSCQAKLALIGRSALPPRKEWDRIAADDQSDPRLRDKVRQVRELESMGAQVMTFSADVSDPQVLKDAVNEAVGKLGPLQGVFHAAGVISPATIRQTDTGRARQVLKPKVAGTLALDQALLEHQPGFLILFSSLSSILPIAGQADYSAANSFLDAFAQSRSAAGGTPTVSINWDVWEDVRMASSSGDDLLKSMREAGQTAGIRESEGIEALSLVLANPAPQVAVSTRDLPRLLEQRHVGGASQSFPAAAPAEALEERPGAADAGVFSQMDKVEGRIAQVWKEVLGIEKIGLQDNFFELGGHSLIATQIVSRLRERFQIEISLASLFESPTIGQLANAVRERAGSASAAEDKEGQAGEKVCPQQPRKVKIAPASFAQERLWFLEKMQPGGPLFALLVAWRLKGNLHTRHLQSALDTLVERQETLRTTFRQQGEELVQVISQEGNIALTTVDLRQLPDRQAEEEVRRRALQLRSFDLGRDALLRSTLFRLAEEDSVLLFNIHHIICDGWSVGVLYQELSQLYQAAKEGGGAPRPDFSMQYADFARWQRAQLEDGVLQEQLKYWENRLRNPTVLDLPTDRPRPPVQSFEGGIKRFRLPLALSEALIQLSRRMGVTLFVTLLTAFKVLLHRYTGHDDIIVSSPVANRRHPATEPLIGVFLNALMLRSDLSANPPWRDLLKQVNQGVLKALDNQDLPFERVLEELHLERDLSRQPISQTVFQLMNTPSEGTRFGDLDLSRFEVDTGTSMFDLTLSLWETPQGLEGKVEYSSDLFEEETVEGWVRHYRRLLEGIVADPARPVSRLPLLEEKEREVL
ncbi:MAG TPA: amino acid adenylation domain-containing protein, partial [Acidobacteriota bacterium]|nr:amino acid adenylation domain-containing protein [Acidobacteriota bacterium]